MSSFFLVDKRGELPRIPKQINSNVPINFQEHKMIQPVIYMMYVIYALFERNNKSLPLKQILAIV